MKENLPERNHKPISWYERSQTPEWFRELEPSPWAATPPYPYTGHQNMVNLELEKLFNTPYPEDTPLPFSELVMADFLAGRAHRETTNAGHYAQWLREHDSHGPRAHEIISRSDELGIEPSKLLDFIRESSIQAIELAKLSVPYGYRMEYLPQLRTEVDLLIRERGGALLEAQPYGHLHANLHRSEDFRTLNGILATYQRNIGRLDADDGTPIVITERQALAIRTDEASGFPADLREQLTDGQIEVSEEAMKNVEQFIQHDTGEKFMVPLSLTVFAHREKREIREEKARAAIAQIHMAAQAVRETTDLQ